MNNRFLFRGMCVSNGEWKQGFLAPAFRKVGDCIFMILSVDGVDDNRVDPATVGQCTGLKDKNGKLIFEGDIIEVFDTVHNIMVTDQVTFLNGCFMFGNWNWHEYLNRFRHYEIIGNIYDNPELLK